MNQKSINDSSQLSRYIIALSSDQQQQFLASYAKVTTFEELNVGGSAVLGGCDSWSSYLYGQTLLDQYYYLPVVVDLISFYGNYSDYNLSYSHHRCTERSVVVQILSSLTSLSTVAGSVYNCSSHLWVVKTCFSYPRICIDCDDPCILSPSMGVASCSLPAATNQTYGFILTVGFSTFGSVAPRISILGYSSTSSSIQIEAGLSKEGLLYCAAYGENLLQPTTTEQVIQQSFSSNVSTTLAVVVIADLTPVTAYTVYCVSISLLGSVTSYADMMKSAISVTTRCCKQISIVMSTGSVVSHTGIQNFFTTTVSHSPSKYALIRITLSNASSALVPKSFPLNRTAVAQAIILATSLNALYSPGRYYYTATVSGASANEYSIEYASSRYFTVISRSSNVNITRPKIVSVYFSSDGTSLQATFDSNTNKAGLPDQFPCNILFEYGCSSSSTCVWQSNAVVILYFRPSLNSSSSCAAPGDLFRIRSSAAIRSQYFPDDECRNCASQSDSLVIGKPRGPPLYPIVVISSPTIMDACADLVIDVAESSGHAGRNWTSFSISVTSGNVDVRYLQYFLDQSFRIHSPAPISFRYFQAGGKYAFAVTLCNFLNCCGSARSNLLVVASPVVRVSFPGPSYREVYRHDELWLRPVIAPSNCSVEVEVEEADAAQYFYSWAVTVNSIRSYELSAYLTPASPEIYLPAFLLIPSSLYEIKLTVTKGGAAPTISSTTTVLLSVLAGKVYPVLLGGLNRTVVGSNTILLDASRSFDQDVQFHTGIDAGLLFQWTCRQTSPAFSISCINVLTMTAQSAASIVVRGIRSPIKQAAQIQLTVTSSDRTKSAVLTVSIMVVDTATSTATLASSSKSGTISSHDYLQLYGEVNLVAGHMCNATWSVSRAAEGLQLARIANSPVNVFLAPKNATRSHKLYLLIPPNSIAIHGLLAFSLFCASPTSTVVSASVTVTINTAPSPGDFRCSPSVGQDYTDPFYFLAQYWFDNDLPLSYEFGYVSPINGNNAVTLRSRAEISSAYLFLPAGSSQFSYSINGSVQVYDSLLANTTALFPLKVMPAVTAIDTSRVLPRLLATIDGGLADKYLQTVSLYAAVVNQVPCDLAPDCAALNRETCLHTPNTCGGCLDGFLGEAVDRNDPCIALSSPKSAQHGHGTFALKNRKLFVALQKACTGNCSGNGQCVFLSKDTGDELSSCFSDDYQCEAVCYCYDGFIGTSACYLPSTIVAQKISYRLDAILAVKKFLQSQRLNTNNLHVVITELSVATQIAEELSLSAFDASFEVIEVVFRASFQLGISISLQNKLSLYQILTSLLSAVHYQYSQLQLSSVDYGGVTSAEQYLALVQVLQGLFADYSRLAGEDMVPGNFPLDSISSSCRVRTMASSVLLNSQSFSLYLPLTALEVYNSAVSTSAFIPVQVQPQVSSSDSNGGVLFYTVNSCPQRFFSALDKQINSNPIFVYASANQSSNVSLVIQNSLPVRRFVDEQLETFDINCYNGFFRVVNHTCSDGTVLQVVCNGTAAGVMRGQCPLTTYHPYCSYALLNESFASKSRLSCNEKQFVDAALGAVTCNCPLFSGYELNQSTMESNSSLTIAYTAKVSKFTRPSVITFSAAPDTPAPEAVYYTIGSILLLIFALLGIGRRNKQAITKEDKKVAPVKKSGPLDFDSVVAARDRDSDRAALKAAAFRIRQLCEALLPQVFGKHSVLEKIQQEMRRHHKIGRFLWPLIIPTRLETVYAISLISENVLIMFFVSEYFSLLNQNSGDCESSMTQQDCVKVHSSAAPTLPLCEWNVDTASRVEQCVFSTTGNFLSVRVTVAAVAAVTGAVLILFLNMILHRCSFSSSPVLFRGYDQGYLRYDVLTPHITAASLDDEVAIKQCKS